MNQLEQLAQPFPAQLVKAPPKGKHGTYVKHSTVTERLLSIIGPFSFEVSEVVRGFAPEIMTRGENPKTYPARNDAIVGVRARLSATIDGRAVWIEEVGNEEQPAMKTDGECLKNATSDALKRCAMRLGLGLHLWSQDDYFLDKQLAKDRTPSDRPQSSDEEEGSTE